MISPTTSTTSSNRMLFNFHPGLNPSQEGDLAVKKQTSEKEVVFMAGGSSSTSPNNHPAIHPSFVPSLLSSFANSPNHGVAVGGNGSQQSKEFAYNVFL